ncbi:MAG TPA: pyridoxal-dependent decarboxylase [Anaerolineales bacterium]|nr:pyridoxal-dependent decarboxylase [Anaerolineales bacterium]
MNTEEFRRNGYAVIDWLANYWQTVEQYPVLSQVQPSEIRAQLPAHPPQNGEAFPAMFSDFEQVLLPGITHWQSPNFFAYFPANTSPASVLGELLSAGLGVQGMLWATSPACTDLETHVLDWLVEMLGLPEKFLSSSSGGGVIHGSASEAMLAALLAARERATQGVTNQLGTNGNLVAYISTQTHSALEKAVKIAGIGLQNLRKIEVDEHFAMRADLLQAQIRADRAAGLLPFMVTATIGTTSSNAIDPIPQIAEICQREAVWLHVDAAMSGTAALAPEFRYSHAGIALADSYAFNPHKWMFTNFDCDCFFVADRTALLKALSILPEYLRNQASESGSVIDYRDWQIPLGRRFRALKLWFVIRDFGVSGLQKLVRQHIAWVQELAQQIASHPDFEVLAPVPFNLVCFRHRLGDEFNQKLLERLNTNGKIYLTHTKLNGRYCLRLCAGQTNVTREHVQHAWVLIQAEAQDLQAQ